MNYNIQVYIKENPPIDKSIPGPSAYVVKNRYVENQGASYSLRPNSSHMSMFVDPTKNYPGPGTYSGGENNGDNKKGFCLLSKYKSGGNAVISKGKERFDNRDLRRSVEVPGPGQYKAKVDLKYKSYGQAVFGSAERLDKGRYEKSKDLLLY